MEENGVAIKIDLSPLLTRLGVRSVLDLAVLGKEKTEHVVHALKKNNQKKWVALGISEKLEAVFSTAVDAANSKSTVGEW